MVAVRCAQRLAGLLLVLLLTACTADQAVDGPGGAPGGDDGRVIAASVPYYDQQRAFDVAKQHTGLFTDISFWWYSVLPNGDIGLLDEPYTEVDRDMVRQLQDQGIRVIPHIANYTGGDWAPQNASVVLRDPALRSTHIRNIVDLVQREGYDGIDIDYESLTDDDREPLVTFMTDLSESLHAHGKLLTISVQPKDSDDGDGPHNRAQDYAALGEVADRVNVMTYDYSTGSSDPGPVAPLEWVDDVLAYTTTRIPPEKVVLGNVLLGYDWGRGEGETVTWTQATELADEHGADVEWDEESQSPWFRVSLPDGPHEVWFENAESTARKLELVDQYELRGAFFWRLGGEDPDTWSRVSDILS